MTDIIKALLSEDSASADTTAAARHASETIRALLSEDDSTSPHLTITSPRGITSYG